MKKIKTILIALFVSNLYLTAVAQVKTATSIVPIDSITKLITYSEVVKQDGSKDSLYNRAIMWTTAYYPNAQDVTKIRDKQNGKIQCKHRFKLYNYDKKDGSKLETGMLAQYTMNIDLKEGKYRFTITDFNLKGGTYYPLEKWVNKTDPMYNANADSYLKQVDDKMKEMIKSLKKGMMPTLKKSDNW